jgi:hypothetical protein
MTENKKPRIGPLDSIKGVRAELGRLYRAWRYAEIENDQIRAGVYCLKEMREALVATDLEGRIEMLERSMEPRKPK